MQATSRTIAFDPKRNLGYTTICIIHSVKPSTLWSLGVCNNISRFAVDDILDKTYKLLIRSPSFGATLDDFTLEEEKKKSNFLFFL